MIKILKPEEGIRMLKNNYIGRLAFVSKGDPYVLPITYFYSEEDNCIISYSEEGHKIQAMRKQNAVSLEVDEIDSVNNWRSVLVHGDYEELSGSYARQQLHHFAEGVKALIKQRDEADVHFISEFSAKLNTGGLPIVYRIHIREITARQRDK